MYIFYGTVSDKSKNQQKISRMNEIGCACLRTCVHLVTILLPLLPKFSKDERIHSDFFNLFIKHISTLTEQFLSELRKKKHELKSKQNHRSVSAHMCLYDLVYLCVDI